MYKLVHVFKYQVNKHSYMRTNFHEYVLTRTHICSFFTCIIEHTFEVSAKICYKNRTYVFLRTHYVSVYSYVALKVHTNVRKVGTHLNVWYIERMFAESTRCCLYERSIYLYIMNISSSVGTRTLSLPRPILYLYYTISIYRKWNTLSRAFFTFLSAPLFTFIFYYILYI